MKSSFSLSLALFVGSIFIFNSCGTDPKEDALAYFETIRYDVYLPSTEAVGEQQEMIQQFMDDLKASPQGDHMDEALELWKINSKTIQDLEDGLNACDGISNFGDETDLLKATKDYLNVVLTFEKELKPAIKGIQGKMDFGSFLKFSTQLKKGQEIDAAGIDYKQAQNDFRNEYGITELDGVKMRSRH